MPKDPPSKPNGQAAPVPKSEEGRSLTLYELTGTYAELAALLDNLDDHDNETEITALLETFRGEIKERADYLGRVIAQKKAEAEWVTEQANKFQDEANRLKARAGVRLNGVERLRNFIKDCMNELGTDTQKFEGATFTTVLSKEGAATVDIVDEELVPAEFRVARIGMPANLVPDDIKQYVISTVVSKQAINEALTNDGVIPPGCMPGPRKRTLRQY